MSNYVPKTKVRWIKTRCSNKRCRYESEAVDFVLIGPGGHTPKCDVCGSRMKFNKGDLKDDQA